MKSAHSTGPAPSGDDLDAIAEIAAEWLARREQGLTADEQGAFSEWLLVDVRHAAAVQEIEVAWRFMQKPRRAGQAEALATAIELQLHARSRSRRRLVYGLSFGGLAAAAAVVAIAMLPLRQSEHQPASIVASVDVKPERQTFSDGSRVELNAGAEINVGFTPERRLVRLVRGQAHFAVAKDPARPFVVTAGSVSVRAVGTEFAVRVEPALVDVVVTEGQVAVERHPSPPAASPAQTPVQAIATTEAKQPTLVDAGNRTVVPVDLPSQAPLQVQPIAAAQIQAALAWRSMRVEFTATPLGEIVTHFNRHNRISLSLGDTALNDVRISGIFWLDDPIGFSRLIEQSAGFKAWRDSADRIVLTKE